MLTLPYVKDLINTHQKYAANHIERLKEKIEKREDCVSNWLFDEKISTYWSHPDTSYLSLSTLDFINYYLRTVQSEKCITELDKVIKATPEELENSYFKHVLNYWKQQGITRSKIPKDRASEEFLDKVFTL